MLQLQVSNYWLDWVYVALSKNREGKVGVYSARDFPRKFIIGFYYGSIIWEADVEGGMEPSELELDASNVMRNDDCCFIRDRNCRMILVDPIVNGDISDPILLKMGMHYIVSVNDKSKANVEIIEDGSIQCFKDISADTELLLFQADEEAEADEAEEDMDQKPSVIPGCTTAVEETELSFDFQLKEANETKLAFDPEAKEAEEITDRKQAAIPGSTTVEGTELQAGESSNQKSLAMSKKNSSTKRKRKRPRKSAKV